MTEPDFLRDTRASYDAVAVAYAERFGDELDARPLDRGMLAGFAERVRAAGSGPVADVGCGTGRVTAYLDGLGVPAFGIDLSPGMIDVARRTYPACSSRWARCWRWTCPTRRWAAAGLVFGHPRPR